MFNYRITAILTLTLMFIMGLSIVVRPALAEPRADINYQGKLTDATGVAVADGTYNMRFWLLQSTGQATTSAVWTEEWLVGSSNGVQVTNGLFSIMLGSTSALTSVDFNQELFLGVEIGGTGGSPAWDGEMSPRKPLGTVPAAFEAFQLGGVASSSFLRSDQADTISANTAGTLLTITQSGTGDILNIFDDATEIFSIIDGGLVGIGTTTPIAELAVGGDFALEGGFYDNNYTRGSNGQVLQTTGSGVEWVSTTTLGFISDISGSSLEELSDVSSMTENLGDLLYWNGTAWADIATNTLNIAVTDLVGDSDDLTEGTTNLFSQWANVTGGINYAGGKVGVGTTTPWASLSLSKTTGGAGPLLSVASSTSGAATSTVFHIDAYGNVGIGTSSLNALLSISASNSAAGNTKIISYRNKNDDTEWFRVTDSGAIYSHVGQALFNNKIQINQSGLTVHSGGYLGIASGVVSGSTNPEIRLYRDSESYVLAQRNSTNAQEYRIYNTDNGSDDEFVSLGWINNSNVFGIETEATGAGTLRDIVLLGGNVGVGTSAPTSKLTVAGDTYLGADLTATGTIAFTALTNGLLLADSNGTLSSVATSSLNLASSTLASGNWTNGYVLQASTTANGGFDWVSTTTLGFGSGGASSLEELSDVSSMTENLGDLLYWNGTAWADIATNTLNIAVTDLGGDSDDLTEGTTNLFSQWANVTGGINYAGGKVGVGTSSPYAKLSISQTLGGTSPLFLISSSTSGAGTSTYFFIDAYGKVGVGTSSPASQFSVDGDFALGETATSSASQQVGTMVWNGTDVYVKTGSATTSEDGWFDAVNNDIHVFLIGGQSNAMGSGFTGDDPPTPEAGTVFDYHLGIISQVATTVGSSTFGSAWPSFGKTYYDATGHKVMFVQASWSGTCQSQECATGNSQGTLNWDDTGTLYDGSVTKLNEALAAARATGFNPVFKGILWMQGESDANSINSALSTVYNYKTAFQEMIDRYRGEYGSSTPFYIFRIGTGTYTDDDGYAQVREAQEQVADEDLYTRVVWRGAIDFPQRNLISPDGFGVHFTRTGYNEMGRLGASSIVSGNTWMNYWTEHATSTDSYIMLGNMTLGATTSTSTYTHDNTYALNVLGKTTSRDGYYVGSMAGLLRADGGSWFMAGATSTSVTSDATFNYAFGTTTLQNLTTGDFNFGAGLGTLAANTTGSANFAYGYLTMASNVSGSNNLGIGQGSLATMTTGNSNVALGQNTLQLNNGTGTIAIGGFAANNATGVDRGIFIGYDIDAFSTTQDNVLNIGNLIFGNSVDGTGTTYSTGNVGIGTSSPYAKLSVAGDAVFTSSVDAADYYLDNAMVLTGSPVLRSYFIAGSNPTSYTSATDNIGIGSNALNSLSTGDNNIAIGTDALSSTNSGLWNVAIGYRSLDANTNGSYNTAVGYDSMLLNTAGVENVAIGINALRSNNDHYNIAIGSGAADNATGVNRGIFIGAQIDAFSTTEDNVLNIGNLIFGNSVDGTGTTYSTGNVGIGTSTPAQKFSVAGQGYFTNTVKARTFTTTGTAQAYYIGSTNVLSLTSSGNTYYLAGATSTSVTSGATGNYAIGISSMTNLTTGDNNVAIGPQALRGGVSGMSGSSNVAFGNSVLIANTSGAGNFGAGLWSLIANTTGSNNISIGGLALLTNTTGNSNVALGASALQSNNGTGTIAIGNAAADNATGVDGGIFIGWAIDAFSTTEDNVLNIGNLIFGNSVDGTGKTYSTGNVGIGTSSPFAKLTIEKTNGGSAPLFSISSSTAGASTSTALFVDAYGNVGIGTSSPTAQLHTNGSVRFETFGAGTLQTDANGNVSVSSDERLKDIIGEYTSSSSINKILGIEPIKYKWSDESGFDTETIYTGFSAQNVKDFIPEAVGKDKQGFLTLSDRPILATVINAIKEMWNKINGLEKKVKEIEVLKSQNAEFERRLQELEKEVGIQNDNDNNSGGGSGTTNDTNDNGTDNSTSTSTTTDNGTTSSTNEETNNSNTSTSTVSSGEPETPVNPEESEEENPTAGSEEAPASDDEEDVSVGEGEEGIGDNQPEPEPEPEPSTDTENLAS